MPIDQGIPAFELGDAIARLQISRIGLDTIVGSGVDREDLKRGPGHYPQTPLPGQVGSNPQLYCCTTWRPRTPSFPDGAIRGQLG